MLSKNIFENYLLKNPYLAKNIKTMKIHIIKTTAFFCLITLFSCSKTSNSNNNNTNNTTPTPTCYIMQDREFTGSVYNFHYDTLYNLIAISQYDTTGVKLDSMYLTYTGGQIAGMNDYGTTKKVVSSVALKYNSSNQVTYYINTNISKADQDFYDIYAYNNNNQISSIGIDSGTYGNGQTGITYNFNYDNSGNVTKVQVFNYTGALTDNFNVAYDGHTSRWANLSQGIRLILGKGLPYSKASYNVYLSNNNVAKVSDYGTGSSLLSIASFTYNYNSGNMPISYTFSYTNQSSKSGSMSYLCK